MRDLGKGEAERGVGMKNDPSSRFLLDSICNHYVRLASEWGLNYFLLTLGMDYFRLQESMHCQRNFNFNVIFSAKLDYKDVLT